MKRNPNIELVLEALAAAPTVVEDDVSWLEEPLLVDEEAWETFEEALPGEILLSMTGDTGAPGSGWYELITVHDLSDGSHLYSWQTVDGNEGNGGTFLIATAQGQHRAADDHVVEGSLWRHGSLALAVLSGTTNELDTTLPRGRLIPCLLAAAEEGPIPVDEVLEDLLARSGVSVDDEPEGTWLERALAPFLDLITDRQTPPG